MRGIPIDSMVKHLSVFGQSGSGKTTTVYHLLAQAHHRTVPFIVFETGKAQYRRLKCLKDHADAALRQFARDLRIYTLGSQLSPLYHNPLALRGGVMCESHMDNILACFKAALPLSGPLPALLGESLEEVYQEHPDRAEPPRLAELVAAMKRILAAKGYSRDVDSDIRAALEVRLGVLTRRGIGRVFQCRQDVPTLEELVTGSSVIELASFPPEQACLLTLFFLIAIHEYVLTTPAAAPLRLILVIEEAHNIVGCRREATTSEENADPQAHAAELVCRMLAELRALGVALIIVDQLPSAVAPEVVKNTVSKLVFREVDQEDRELLGGAMLFGPLELEEIARLRPGEAYFITEGYFGPRRIRTPNLLADWQLPLAPIGDALAPYLIEDTWFRRAAENRVAAEAQQLQEEMDLFEMQRIGMIREAKAMVQLRLAILGNGQEVAARLAPLARRILGLRHRLHAAWMHFQRDAYRPFQSELPAGLVLAEDTRRQRTELAQRFDRIIQPGTQAMLNLLDRLIRDCTRINA